METATIITLADGTEHMLPHQVEELLEILEHHRRYGSMPGLEVSCCGTCIWINPDLVTAVRVAH